MIYYYTSNGNITHKESDFVNPKPRVNPIKRVTMYPIQSDLDIPVKEYCVVNEVLAKREPLQYTLPKDAIDINEVLTITVPVDTQYRIESSVIVINGTAVAGTIEFSSEIVGEYLIVLLNHPYQITYLKVTVNE